MATTPQNSSFFRRFFGPRLLKSWRLWGLLLLLTYTLVGFFGVPYLLKTQLIAKTPEFTDRVLTLKQVKFNPFALSLYMQGVSLADLDGDELVGLDELHVNFEVESLFRWAWTFDEIHFAGPRFNLRIDESGQTTFSDLLAGDENTPPPQSSGDSSELPRLVLHAFKVSNGQFDFEDRSIATPYQQRVSPIAFELTGFSTLPEREGPYAIQATLPDGAAIRWQGEVSVNPIRSTGSLEVDQFNLTTAWRYAQDQLRFEVDQGLLAASTQYDLAMGSADLTLTLDQMKLALNDIIIRDKNRSEPDITLSEIALTGGQLNLGEQKVQFDQLTVAGGEVNTFLNPQGEIDLARLFSPIEAAPSTEKEETAQKDGNGWLVELNKATVTAFNIDMTDQSTSPNADLRIDDITIKLANISNRQDERFALNASLLINQEGSLALEGEVGAIPVMADLSLALERFPLKSIQPYLNTNTHLDLKSGHAAFKGQLSYMAPESPAELQLTGRVAIYDFAAGKHKTRGEVIAWKELSLDPLALQIAPDRLDIKTITFDRLKSELVVAKDQTMNIDGLVKENPAGEQSEPAADKPFPITVEQVVLKRNAVSFTDNSVSPRFTFRLSELKGTVKGLSSENIARADVNLNGKIDDYAKLKVSGQVNPLSENLYTDLKIDFLDYDMSSFTPYTGKFIGKAVDKGRMGLNLVYKISQQELKGDNHILLDQFTLGRKIESEEATSLPVGLAIALLKDANGRIDIDMPIRGNLDDPEFGFMHLLPPALMNLVTGIVSSPFKLLGKLAGGSGDDELDHVLFAPGEKQLTASQLERLKTLGNVLQQRPQLSLEIRGQYTLPLDKPVLQQQMLHLALQLPADVPTESATLTQLEAFYTGQTDVERLAAIKAENSHLPEGAEEGDAKVLDQTTYKAALYQAAIEMQPLVEADLRDLALARANHIRNVLVENSGLASERVFILEAGEVASEAEQMIRAQFDLGAS